jgi:hypothetical protein
LDRLEELVDLGTTDEGLQLTEMLPAIVVSVRPAFAETATWYPTAATATLLRIFGSAGLRVCEACMVPRLQVQAGILEQDSSEVTMPEVVRLDNALRGASPPARVALWLDENPGGVSLRAVDVKNSRILLAHNVGPALEEQVQSERMSTLARELGRRARGDTITHAMSDWLFYPGVHIGFDWADQWGEYNENLSGFALSLVGPVLGAGGAYYRVIPEAWGLSLGAKALVSIPTAFIMGVTSDSFDALDPIVNGVFMVRLPIFRSNYAITAFVSIPAFSAGIGMSTLNISFLPFLP